MNSDGKMELIDDVDAVTPPHSLNARQRTFCVEYILTGGNKAKAARYSGYSWKNSSSIGCRLLKRTDIQTYIDQLRVGGAEASRRVPDIEAVGSEMARAKNETVASTADLFTVADGVLRFRDPQKLNSHALQLIESFEADEAGNVTGYRLNPANASHAFCRMLQLAGRP